MFGPDAKGIKTIVEHKVREDGAKVSLGSSLVRSNKGMYMSVRYNRVRVGGQFRLIYSFSRSYTYAPFSCYGTSGSGKQTLFRVIGTPPLPSMNLRSASFTCIKDKLTTNNILRTVC